MIFEDEFIKEFGNIWSPEKDVVINLWRKTSLDKQKVKHAIIKECSYRCQLKLLKELGLDEK